MKMVMQSAVYGLVMGMGGAMVKDRPSGAIASPIQQPRHLEAEADIEVRAALVDV